jgi:uncharacterized protein (DUF849 family)
VAAGANALHVHPRAPDGAATLDPEWTDAVVAAIRAACPGTPVGLTTSLLATHGDPVRRREAVEGWRVLPDFVSVNVSEPGFEELCDALRARGVGVEAGVWSLPDADALGTGPFLRVLVEPWDLEPAVAVATVMAIDERLVAAGVEAPQLHHGEGFATWAVLAAAVERGRDIRIGLEDTLVLPDGRPARDNAELVAAAARLADRGVR